MTRAPDLRNRPTFCPRLVLILLVPAFSAPADAYEINVLAAIFAEDNHDSTATYTGTHTLQVLEVEPSDTDVVGVQGRLYKSGFLPSVVSQCSTGGQLPQAWLHVCETQWTQSCTNPDGPSFQAFTSSDGISKWSAEVTEYCPEGPPHGGPMDPPIPPGTPILVDLERNRFHLTGLADPVFFDIDADGDLEVLSWTSAGTLDAFLFLDRNGDGVVDSGAELFGAVTPLIDGSTAENGYIPLAEFDLAAIGGNGNGLIDPGDVIYPELRLWIDLDHDGISAPGELLGLADAGVTRLDLQYWTSRIHDGHGNYFRYISRAWILIDGHEKMTWTTDVFFVVGE